MSLRFRSSFEMYDLFVPASWANCSCVRPFFSRACCMRTPSLNVSYSFSNCSLALVPILPTFLSRNLSRLVRSLFFVFIIVSFNVFCFFNLLFRCLLSFLLKTVSNNHNVVNVEEAEYSEYVISYLNSNFVKAR